MRKTAVIVLVLAISLLAPAEIFAEPGEDIFRTKCVVCHGQMGSGKTPVGARQKLRPLSSPGVQKLTDAELTAMIATGGPKKDPKHSFKKSLSDEQIKAVVAFIRSLPKPQKP